MDLNNPKDKATIQSILKEGIKTDFWDVICQALERRITDVKNEEDSDNLKSLPSNEYKTESVILKAKRTIYEELKKLPTEVIDELESLENYNKDSEDDPYDKPED